MPVANAVIAGQVRGREEDHDEQLARRLRVANLRVAHIAEMFPTGLRSEESIKKSRQEQIDQMVNTEAVKDWEVDEASDRSEGAERPVC